MALVLVLAAMLLWVVARYVGTFAFAVFLALILLVVTLQFVRHVFPPLVRGELVLMVE